MDNESDPHTQPAAARSAGISFHPQDMQRVFVMLDPVLQSYRAAVDPLRHTEDVISVGEFV
jgi:hypothetical protein